MVVRAQKRGTNARNLIYACVTTRYVNGEKPPTIREIAEWTSYGIATVHRHVGILVTQGELRRKDGALLPVPKV